MPRRCSRRYSSHRSSTPRHVIVSVPALADAFFQGIDRHVVDLFKDPERAATANERLDWLILELPHDEQGTGAVDDSDTWQADSSVDVLTPVGVRVP